MDEEKKPILLEYAKQHWRIESLIDRFDLWSELEDEFEALSDNERIYIAQRA